MSKKTAVILSAFMAFWIFGFTDILKGSVIPYILDEGSLSYSMGGALLGFTYFGFFSGTLGSVFLLKKGFAPYLMFFAVLISCLGSFLFGSVSQGALFFLATYIIGIGSGLIDVSANITVKMSSSPNKLGRNMNLLAFFHGLGAIIAPVFAGLVLSSNQDWHNVYFYAAIIVTILIVFITISVFTSYPVKRREMEQGEVGHWNKSVVFLALLLFFYMTVEAGIAGWLVEYYITYLQQGEALSLFSLSLFFILITAGRLFSSFYADRIGLDNTLLYNLIAAMICLILGVSIESAAILIPCSGFFLATVFPSTAALISTVLRSGNIRILGAFFSIGGLGGLVGPWMIGVLARKTDLDTAFLLLIPFSLCCVLSIQLFKRYYNERTDIQPAAL